MDLAQYPFWVGQILLFGFATVVAAQSLAVSSTGAWSSQIIAFWGAVIIGIRASEGGKISTPFAYEYCIFRAWRSSRAITNALMNGNWYMRSGWNNGLIRLDIAIITWSNRRDLLRLARRVALQIEAAGERWEVLVVGLQVEGNAHSGVINWIKCPRSRALCNVKTQDTAEDVFPLDDADLAEGVRLISQVNKSSVYAVIEELSRRCLKPATRPAYLNEVPRVINGVEADLSWAGYFTSIALYQSPYAEANFRVDAFGTGKIWSMRGFIRLYSVVHIALSVAIGLMGAASGRGLAVWLVVLRVSVSSLGTRADAIPGADILLTLFAIDGCAYFDLMPSGSIRLAGDVEVGGMPLWVLLTAAAVPLLEFSVISAGWAYGALNAERFKPTGLVGHGMLGLSAATSIALSLRAFLGLRKRLKGRLIGTWNSTYGVRLALGVRSLTIPTDKILSSPKFSKSELSLIALVAQHSSLENQFVMESLFRHPHFASLLSEFLVTEILQYRYGGDDIQSRGDPPADVSPATEYPWIQTLLCVIFPLVGCCASSIFAYYPLPLWVKLLTEVLVAFSVMYFSTLEMLAMNGLHHDRDCSLSFTVSALVVCSVWYVGVRDVG